MKGKGEHFADARRKAADARRKARAKKKGGGSTAKLAKNIATVKKHTKKGSERAGMIKSLRQKQARKANQMHEG